MRAARYTRGRLESPRIAGTRLVVRRHGIDLLLPLRRIRLGEQPDGRHLREIGIPVELVTVGERELQGLRHRVNVLGRVMAHALEVEALQ